MAWGLAVDEEDVGAGGGIIGRPPREFGRDALVGQDARVLHSDNPHFGPAPDEFPVDHPEVFFFGGAAREEKQGGAQTKGEN
jgi:hypothetical protein